MAGAAAARPGSCPVADEWRFSIRWASTMGSRGLLAVDSGFDVDIVAVP